MTAEQQVMWMLKGLIAELPAEDRTKVESAAAEVRAVATRDKHGWLAAALVASEMSAEELEQPK